MEPEGENQAEPVTIRDERPVEHALHASEGGGTDVVPTVRPEHPSHSKYKRNCLLVIVSCSLAQGILDGLAPLDEWVPPLFGVPVIIAALGWCVRDANERGKRLSHRWRAAILFVTPVAVVAYLLVHRRVGVLAKAVAFCLVCTVVCGIAGLTTYRLHWGTWPEG